MAMAEIVLAFILSFLIIVCYWIFNTNSATGATIRKWPVIGMLPGLVHNAWRVNDFIHNVLKHNGYTFVFTGPWLFKVDFVITSDPMNVQHVFIKNFANYPRGPEYKMIFEPLGDGIFNCDDAFWRLQRKIINTLIRQTKFEFALEKTILQKMENGLIPVLDHASKLGIAVDLQDVFQRFTFDNICLLVLGFDPKCLSVDLEEVAYLKAFGDMEEGVIHRHIVPESLWKLQRWLQIGGEKKFSKAWEMFDKFLYDCISTKRQKLLSRRKTTLEEEFDLLTPFLVEEENEMTELGKSDKFLRDMAFNLLAAGRDSISATLVWFFWLVATHPSVEEKILEEIKANLQHKQGKFFGTKEVSKLVYLYAAICESLRLYPAVPFEHRRSIKSDILPSGHRIKENTRMLFSIYSMGRNEETWGKDCLEFKPERWISEGGGITHVPSHKFFAFLAGPRACVGKDMAFIQMKMVATSIIWNYHINVEEGHLVTPVPSVILHMKHGLKVRVTKRQV